LFVKTKHFATFSSEEQPAVHRGHAIPGLQGRFFLGPANIGGPQRLNVEILPELPVRGIGVFLSGPGVDFSSAVCNTNCA